MFNSPVQKGKTTYYYRNAYGKVISLSKEVAFEQHNLHPEFLGSSDDLRRTGWSLTEAIAKHLKENVPNPTLPSDERKIQNRRGQWYVKGQQPQQTKPTDILSFIKNNKEVVRELLKEDVNTQKPEVKIQQPKRKTGKA